MYLVGSYLWAFRISLLLIKFTSFYYYYYYYHMIIYLVQQKNCTFSKVCRESKCSGTIVSEECCIVSPRGHFI